MNLQWETIAQISTSDTTQRLRVPGGWLVCRLNGIYLPNTMTSWFVSDPDHTWDVSDAVLSPHQNEAIAPPI